MEADVGGEGRHALKGCDENYTYNVSAMFYDAIGAEGIRSLNGKTGEEAKPILEAAIKNMESAPDKYKALNPPNKWGDYEGALQLLKTLLQWCTDAPKAFLVIT